MNRAERITLTPEEQATIDRWAKGKSIPLRLVQRAQIIQLAAKKSQRVVSALAERLGCYPEALRRLITYDNGSENVEHQKINEALGTRSYFCNPYHSWEKGSVEYAIGLIRRFLPKKTNFAIIRPSKLKTIETLLDNRPRKCLKFKTPAEIFSSCVALAG